jgi:hypothetical protein
MKALNQSLEMITFVSLLSPLVDPQDEIVVIELDALQARKLMAQCLSQHSVFRPFSKSVD